MAYFLMGHCRRAGGNVAVDGIIDREELRGAVMMLTKSPILFHSHLPSTLVSTLLVEHSFVIFFRWHLRVDYFYCASLGRTGC